MRKFFVPLMLGLGLSAWSHAQDANDLLPIEEAYKLSVDAGTPGVVKLHWVIAPGYYLYRGQMKFVGGKGTKLGQAKLPAGEKHHDEYLGDVETYHNTVEATVPYTLSPNVTTVAIRVTYQGCHEVDPKLCYPPHTETLNLPSPAAATGSRPSSSSSK